MSFETAIYTDVRAHEAVDGVDGFNFQAVSRGIDGVDHRAIRERMLHQISTHWPIDRDEREHPPTAAFLKRDGRFYFSRGLSTGATANGRRGNQLTQAIVTRELDDIQPYRPAQIMGAASWRIEKSSSTSCEPWFAPLELNADFEADALLTWLQNDEWMQQVLPAYLTMLEGITEDNPRKVVLIHDDIGVVMRWMALGTLLLDANTANSLEFRAFVADPYQTSAQLVGVHPELAQGVFSGAHILNISERTISEIQVSESAQVVTEWISRLDTFDALEVIDIARRWMPAIGIRYGAAGAEMVTGTRIAQLGREEWDLGVEIIEGLASNGLRSDLELYLDELTGSVSAYQLQSEDDFARAARATRFAVGSEIPGLAEALLDPSLESLAKSPQFASTWVQGITSDGTWIWPRLENSKALAENLSDIILAAPDSALSDLLQLVKPLSPILSESKLHSAVVTAVDFVRHNSNSARAIDDWFCSARARTLLRSRLLAELTTSTGNNHKRVHDELQAGVWDFLDPAEDALTAEAPLFLSWLCAAHIARHDPASREEKLRSTHMRPGPDTWEFVLQHAHLPENAALWAAWVELIDPVEELQNVITEQLEKLLDKDPKYAKNKDIHSWTPLLKALTSRYPNDIRYQSISKDFYAFIEEIPTMMDRAAGAVGTVKGFFNGRKKE